MSNKIKKWKLEKFIVMTGQASMEQYQTEMENCDAVINACLKEGGVTNAFDCMKWGKPLLCIDTGGYTRNFNEQCAVILPRMKREEQIQGLKRGILHLCDDETRKFMSANMVGQGSKISWDEKGKMIYKVIAEAWNRNGQ